MKLMAIDPGRDTGWAVLDDLHQLVACGLGDPPMYPDVTEVIIERPQVYRGRSSKGDPNDLITLAIQVGRYTEREEARGRKVTHILPREWKGTVDPDILCKRVYAALTDGERKLMDSVLVPLARKPLADDLTAGKRHNVLDAAGIAVWAAGSRLAGRFHRIVSC